MVERVTLSETALVYLASPWLLAKIPGRTEFRIIMSIPSHVAAQKSPIKNQKTFPGVGQGLSQAPCQTRRMKMIELIELIEFIPRRGNLERVGVMHARRGCRLGRIADCARGNRRGSGAIGHRHGRVAGQAHASPKPVPYRFVPLCTGLAGTFFYEERPHRFGDNRRWEVRAEFRTQESGVRMEKRNNQRRQD